MKCFGVYRARGDFAKCGLAEMKFAAVQWRFVKLQRPPPAIRIFLPTFPPRSSTPTRRPRFPASIAHISPAAPAPKISTSNFLFIFSLTGFERLSQLRQTSKTVDVCILDGRVVLREGGLGDNLVHS